MKKFFLTLFFSSLIACRCLAAVQQSWVSRYSLLSDKTNQAIAMSLSPDGNVVVAGSSVNTNNDLDYLVIKYSSNGTQTWLTRFDSTNTDDQLRGMALDGNGNIVLTGTSKTAKFNPAGNLLWTNSYGGRGVAADSNNVYVTGFSDVDFATARLNTLNGSNIWTAAYGNSIGRRDVSQVIACDTVSNVYVGGFETYIGVGGGLEGYRQMTVIKYNSAGVVDWIIHPMNTSQDGLAYANAICPDNLGNVFTLGNHTNAYPCFVTAKSDSGGTELWRWKLDDDSGLGYTGYGRAMKVDQAGKVYLTGTIQTGTGGRYCTVALTNGHRAWRSEYKTVDGLNEATSIALDTSGNVYVTGYCPSTNSGSDIVTIKYSTNGTQLWVQSYDGPAHGDDIATGIVVDTNNNVYVTGYSATTNGGTEFVTIKYSQKPALNIEKQPGGSMRLKVFADPGQLWGFQTTTNFLQDWQTIGTNTTNTNGVAQFDDTNTPPFPPRFYRGVSPPLP